jgi:hypothetical protein
MIIDSSKPSAGRTAREGGSAMDAAWSAEGGQDVRGSCAWSGFPVLRPDARSRLPLSSGDMVRASPATSR